MMRHAGVAPNFSDKLHSPYRLSVAPMMGVTHRHARYLYRLLSPHCLLYSEMLSAPAALHGDAQRLLARDETETPVALQLGGSEPAQLAKAALLAEKAGFDEINLNAGCPSQRVCDGSFGAVLMKDPQRVAACFCAMAAATSLPVTVKCRLGVDHQNPAETLPEFLEMLAEAGCKRVVIHARKAWLRGLDPKRNRTVPPLDHALVGQMKVRFPDMVFILNGGITDLPAVDRALEAVDGVMVGRRIEADPFFLHLCEKRVFPASASQTDPQEMRLSVVEAMIRYSEKEEKKDAKEARRILAPALRLAYGLPGARLARGLIGQAGLPSQLLRRLGEILAHSCPECKAVVPLKRNRITPCRLT